MLLRIVRLASALMIDPDAHVRRSAEELRAAFSNRGRLEPAVARIRQSVQMLREGNRDGARREFQRRAHGVDHLEQVVERELLPKLRRIGFEV